MTANAQVTGIVLRFTVLQVEPRIVFSHRKPRMTFVYFKTTGESRTGKSNFVQHFSLAVH
jgi:hypothetical protein